MKVAGARRAAAEALGTFFLVLIGPGAVRGNDYSGATSSLREAPKQRRSACMGFASHRTGPYRSIVADRLKLEAKMRRVLLAAMFAAALGCARNRTSEAAGARIHDTTLTAADTTNPNDTLPRIRDSVADSMGR